MPHVLLNRLQCVHRTAAITTPPRLALDAAPSMSRLSERLAAWRVKPDAATEDALAAASAPGFFLVQRPGPSAFVVREEGRAGAPLRVLVGARQTCSCGGGMATRARRSEARAPTTERLLRERNVAALAPPAAPDDDDDDASRVASVCAHIAFVMTRVLRVPRSNPLAWQLSLVDRELDETLRCELASGRARTRGRTGDDARASRSLTALSREDENENKNKNNRRRGDSRGRRDLGPDEPCPICYEPMDDVDDDPTSARDAANRTVVWCRGERRPKKTEEDRRPPADANEPSSSLSSNGNESDKPSETPARAHDLCRRPTCHRHEAGGEGRETATVRNARRCASARSRSASLARTESELAFRREPSAVPDKSSSPADASASAGRNKSRCAPAPAGPTPTPRAAASRSPGPPASRGIDRRRLGVAFMTR